MNVRSFPQAFASAVASRGAELRGKEFVDAFLEVAREPIDGWRARDAEDDVVRVESGATSEEQWIALTRMMTNSDEYDDDIAEFSHVLFMTFARIPAEGALHLTINYENIATRSVQGVADDIASSRELLVVLERVPTSVKSDCYGDILEDDFGNT